jgi:RNA polymerase sigma-70 factor (ECF subfamily)
MSFIDASNAGNYRAGVAGQGAKAAYLERVTKPGSRPRARFGCATWTDTQLVFAAPEVRDVAFAELFVRHSASVAAVARMVLGAANSGSDDVVAEVFTALWSAPDKFDPDRGSLLGFLRLRARGRSIDLLRGESSRHRREQHDESARTSSPPIDAQLEAAELGDALRHAVSRLPEGERMAIELAYFDGMTYRAVACQLDLPEGTVKSRIRSGLQRLRDHVESDERPAVGEPPTETDSSTRERRIRQ